MTSADRISFVKRAVNIGTRFVLVLGMLLLSPGATIAVAQAASGRSDDMARLTAAMELTKSMRDELDATSFDVGELGLELAFEEPAGIAAYVREHIAYEQYPGLLRGAEGTLVSGAGNALDQAVLLATLLGDAGYDVRIAAGQLGAQDAERLVRTMTPSGQATSASESPFGPDSVEETALALGVSTAELQRIAATTLEETDALRSEVNGVASALTDALGSAGLLGDPPVALEALVEEARTYHWVEYSVGGPWVPAHVLFPEGEGPNVAADAYLDNEVPAELQHRFRFQVFVEQRLGDELVAKPVTAAWERPTANMHGVALTYLNVPDGVAGDGEDLQEILADTTYFIPTLNGVLAEGAMSFDLEGNTADPADAANPAAGVFRNVAGAFGRAAGALAGEPDPDAFVTLTAQWIEYTLIAPGGGETVHRRMIVDRIGAQQREAGVMEPAGEMDEAQLANALATSYTFLLAPGHYSEAYVMDRQMAATLAARPMLESAVEAMLDPNAPEVPVPAEYQSAARGKDLLKLFAAFDIADLPATSVSYRAEPGLVVVERALDQSRELVDVVNNRRRVLSLGDDVPAIDRPSAVIQGVWETRLEGMVLSPDAAHRQGSYGQLAAATLGHELRVISPGEVAEVADLRLPPASLAAIEDDLTSGYAVVVSPDAVEEGELAAWWRVDPEDGETLGRSADGRGGELAEYEQQLKVEAALLKASLALGAMRAVAACVGKGSAGAIGCCIYENVIIGTVMLGIGGILATGFAISALALFVVLDLGVGLGLTISGIAGWLPSFCGASASGCRPRSSASVWA